MARRPVPRRIWTDASRIGGMRSRPCVGDEWPVGQTFRPNSSATPIPVRSYKLLALVERAFRCIKTVDLQVCPVHHWRADRVSTHVFLCMLAHYLEFHMRQCLAPMLYDDTASRRSSMKADSSPS